jgi:hypothetical protein
MIEIHLPVARHKWLTHMLLLLSLSV